MDVELYVYDLSRGIARQMSQQLLGVHIDAVYHTALVFGGIEYFYGAGVQTCYPGTTHHGRPMEVIAMGRTDLPIEIILEYLDSLKTTYTAESYDLFAHNCNNFTHDFATFLLGKGIPEHITSLPRTVLDTPFGQMLRPQLDSAMRGITQAPAPPQSVIRDQARALRHPATSNGTSVSTMAVPATSNGAHVSPLKSSGEVYNVRTIERLNQLLANSKSSCAIVFFTSATCGPCRVLYPTYDQLAAETEGKCFLIKVDISEAREVGSKYAIRATPTFITYVKGKQESTWSGSSPPQLQGAVRMLVESAFPPHPHQMLSLPTFRRQSFKPVLYKKVPPLDKVQSKMGPMASAQGIQAAMDFIRQREKNSNDAPIPDMSVVSASIEQCLRELPVETRFIALDILRLMLADARISGLYISSPSTISTLAKLFDKVVFEQENQSYSLRLCALHSACNIFTAQQKLLIDSGTLANPDLMTAWLTLLSAAMLDKEKPVLRNAAANLAYNLATIQMQIRQSAIEAGTSQASTGLAVSSQVELAAALVAALGEEEESADAVKWMAIALARLVYLCPVGEESEVLDLCVAMDAGDVVLAKEKVADKADKVLLHEIGSTLLQRGLNGKGS